MPSGCEVVNAHNGDKNTSVRPAFAPNGAEPADFSGVDYKPAVEHCSANDNTCKAPRANNTELCIGHLRAHLKKQIEQGE